MKKNIAKYCIWKDRTMSGYELIQEWYEDYGKEADNVLLFTSKRKAIAELRKYLKEEISDLKATLKQIY